MASEREDLTQQIRDAASQQLQNDLTKTLNSVVARMELKGEQIVKLKRCQDLVTVYSPSCNSCISDDAGVCSSVTS